MKKNTPAIPTAASAIKGLIAPKGAIKTKLKIENKKVIIFWKAFEEERWLACELHYKCFKKGA